jgi:hypothetical protein
MLTLWLDPGRIKRDLQPNKTLGPPLKRGEHCSLLIKNDWRDAEGVSLGQAFHKDFEVGVRDSISPDPAEWVIDAPESGTVQTLQVNFPERWIMLLGNTIYIGMHPKAVAGSFIKEEKGAGIKPWPHGNR